MIVKLYENNKAIGYVFSILYNSTITNISKNLDIDPQWYKNLLIKHGAIRYTNMDTELRFDSIPTINKHTCKLKDILDNENLFYFKTKEEILKFLYSDEMIEYLNLFELKNTLGNPELFVDMTK